MRRRRSTRTTKKIMANPVRRSNLLDKAISGVLTHKLPAD
jgi:hypothetical protein